MYAYFIIIIERLSSNMIKIGEKSVNTIARWSADHYNFMRPDDLKAAFMVIYFC